MEAKSYENHQRRNLYEIFLEDDEKNTSSSGQMSYIDVSELYYFRKKTSDHSSTLRGHGRKLKFLVGIHMVIAILKPCEEVAATLQTAVLPAYDVKAIIGILVTELQKMRSEGKFKDTIERANMNTMPWRIVHGHGCNWIPKVIKETFEICIHCRLLKPLGIAKMIPRKKQIRLIFKPLIWLIAEKTVS